MFRAACIARMIAGWCAVVCLARAAVPTGHVVIKGSNTFAEELAPRLVAAFRAAHPGAMVTVESKGSASGVAALLAGECDIASSSRYATEDELRLARSRGEKLKSTLIGFYGVAVIVSAANPIDDLSDGRVREIFTGAITNWKAAGGADAPIHVFIRDPSAGTYLGFQELALDRQPYVASAQPLKQNNDIVAAVRRDPAAIGFVGVQQATLPGIKAVRINRVTPSVSRINLGDYPYSRGLRFYTLAGKTSKAAEAFIAFVLSRPGQNELANAGFAGLYDQTIPSFEW